MIRGLPGIIRALSKTTDWAKFFLIATQAYNALILENDFIEKSELDITAVKLSDG